MTPHLILVKCRRCSKFRHPKEFIAGPTVGYCLQCYEGHRAALEMLSGNPPRGCQECEVTFQQLLTRPGADVRMYVHWKDGIYSILCKVCSDEYEHKRLDLYQGTPHGHAINL